MRRLFLLGLVPLVLLLGAACSGDDDDDGGEDASPTATEEMMDDASATATEEPMDDATAEPTEEMMDEGPLLAFDGVSCTGDWTNLTFGSTGSFDATFASNEAGDAGTATIDLGGFVFGAGGGTVELPLMVEGDQIVVDSAADFLGTAKLTFDTSGNAVDAVFEAPPAFNNAASKATLEDFAFDGSSLTTTIQIDFGDGTSATSEIASTCG